MADESIDTAAESAAAEPRAKRPKPTEGWIKEGDTFTKLVEGSPEEALKTARKLVSKAHKQKTSVTLSFEEAGLKVGLPAEGKKFSIAAKPLARSLGSKADTAAEG